MRTFTENVSRSGMLMRWMVGVPLPKVDRRLVLDVELPENSEFGPRVMRCRAQVMRVEGEGDSYVVGLRVLSMRFMKPSREITASDLLAMPVPASRVS